MKRILFLAIFSCFTFLSNAADYSQEAVVGQPDETALSEGFMPSFHSGTLALSSSQSYNPASLSERRRFFLFRWLFGERRSPASASSRSEPHSNEPKRRTSTPDTRSVDPGEIGEERSRPVRSASSPPTTGQRQEPLGTSLREDYYGVGSREIGISFGTAHSFVDLTGTKTMGFGDNLEYQFQNIDFTAGIFGRYRVNNWFGLNVGLDYARFTGENTDGAIEDLSPYRFENDVFEVSGKMEFFIPMRTATVFDIYAFGGISLFYTNPSLFDQDGTSVAVEASYSQMQPAIPFGIGVSGLVGNRIKIGYELGYRYTVLNSLDGLELPDTRYDSYLFNALKVGFLLSR